MSLDCSPPGKKHKCDEMEELATKAATLAAEKCAVAVQSTVQNSVTSLQAQIETLRQNLEALEKKQDSQSRQLVDLQSCILSAESIQDIARKSALEAVASTISVDGPSAASSGSAANHTVLSESFRPPPGPNPPSVSGSSAPMSDDRLKRTIVVGGFRQFSRQSDIVQTRDAILAACPEHLKRNFVKIYDVPTFASVFKILTASPDDSWNFYNWFSQQLKKTPVAAPFVGHEGKHLWARASDRRREDREKSKLLTIRTQAITELGGFSENYFKPMYLYNSIHVADTGARIGKTTYTGEFLWCPAFLSDHSITEVAIADKIRQIKASLDQRF